jgi:2Fe-2S ferredoxin
MARIVIKNLGEKIIEVQDLTKTFLQHLQDNAIDWMQACGGKGRCTTCKVMVLKGNENLSPKTTAEIKYEREGALGKNERLVCQIKCKGDVSVAVPEEYKLPHMKYSS